MYPGIYVRIIKDNDTESKSGYIVDYVIYRSISAYCNERSGHESGHESGHQCPDSD